MYEYMAETLPRGIVQPEKYIQDYIQIEKNMIVLSVFFMIVDPTEFFLVHYEEQSERVRWT